MNKTEKLLNSKKISIFGYPATGKTTLANKLGSLLNIEVYSLDKIRFKKNEVFIKSKVKDFEENYNKIFKNKSWIVEGNALDYIDNRLKESDILIFLRSNKYISVLKYIIRNIKINILKLEERDGTNNNKEKFNIQTVKWILSRYNGKIKKLEAKLKEYEDKIIVIKSYSQLNQLIENLNKHVIKNL